MVILRGPVNTRTAMQDFGVDGIQALTRSKIPTIWALKNVKKSESASILSTADLLKCLTHQLLKISKAGGTERQMALRSSQFHTLQTDQEWFGLFEQAVMNVGGQVYLMIDLATVSCSLGTANGFNSIQELSHMLNERPGHPTMARVKIILLAYEIEWSRRLPVQASSYVVLVKPTGSKRPQGKAMQQAVNRHVFPNRGKVHGQPQRSD